MKCRKQLPFLFLQNVSQPRERKHYNISRRCKYLPRHKCIFFSSTTVSDDVNGLRILCLWAQISESLQCLGSERKHVLQIVLSRQRQKSVDFPGSHSCLQLRHSQRKALGTGGNCIDLFPSWPLLMSLESILMARECPFIYPCPT